MRLLAPMCLALSMLAGCITSSADTAGVPEPDPGDGAAAQECVVAADCTAAGPSCCACPTFAVVRDSGWEDSCEDVTCEIPPTDCPAAAACEQGACVLACAEIACDGALQCESGPAVDELGCLSCACANPDPSAPASECQVDADCVQVPADCCGCDQGGADTAVPAAEAVGFSDSLGCSGEGTCPGVNVCDASQMPRCSAGECVLAAAPSDEDRPDAGPGVSEPQLCGSTALPPCPAGWSCVLNAADAEDATRMGLGVCRP